MLSGISIFLWRMMKSLLMWVSPKQILRLPTSSCLLPSIGKSIEIQASGPHLSHDQGIWAGGEVVACNTHWAENLLLGAQLSPSWWLTGDKVEACVHLHKLKNSKVLDRNGWQTVWPGVQQGIVLCPILSYLSYQHIWMILGLTGAKLTVMICSQSTWCLMLISSSPSDPKDIPGQLQPTDT